MTAMYGYTKSWDWTFLKYLEDPPKIQNTTSYWTDLDQVNRTTTCRDAKSILAYLDSNPNTRIFRDIVRIAELERELDGSLSRITVFVPTDNSVSGIDLNTIDKLEARKIVLYSILSHRVYKRNFVVGLYDTKFKNNQIWIQDGTLNKRAKVTKWDIERCNGIVHLTNGFF
jgi:uncharacterized surface protein with fasciclin (FAS1) repeats